jgi:acyl carrier protein
MGAQALVLSHDGQLCGINEPGEIALRTPFRCLGYLNAPEETQKRLAKNPFREDPDDVVYFTGDRGRYRPDGSLEILGRIDDQVKVRGVRVEPAEIAAILSQHSLVDSCFVVGRKDEREEMCLVAYVIASTHDLPTSAQLRSYLLDRLPIPMVPSIFVFVEALPLTPNGKVDRNALPQPDYQRHGAEDGFLAPRNPIEQVISEIWAEVLKIERIGIHDNFFDAGGHSLLAVRVLSRITQAFQSTVSLKDFFESPTVAQMANVIEEQKQTQTAMPKDLERFVTDLENISEDDAQRLLTQQSQRG